MRRVLAVLALLMAGCMGGNQALPQPTGLGDGVIAVRGTVIDPVDFPVHDATIKLFRSDGRHYEAATGEDGTFELLVPVLEPCYLQVDKNGFRKTRFDLACTEDVNLLLRIEPAKSLVTRTLSDPVSPGAKPNQGPFDVQARVLDAGTGKALSGAQITYARPGESTRYVTTNSSGVVWIRLQASEYEFSVSRTCYDSFQSRQLITGPTDLNFLITRPVHAAPAAPSNVRAVTGPGHGQVTIAWKPPEGTDCGAVYQHQIYRGTSRDNLSPLIRIGNSHAFADSGRASGTFYYQVAAIDRYGMEGAGSEVVQGSGKITGIAPTVVSTRALDLAIRDEEYPVLDAAGEETGVRTWRVVQSLGNCCENYYAVGADGTLYDFGGTFLRVSRDEGVTWSEVVTPVPYLTGEGAVTIAPNGDVVGVGWSPYGGDQLWAHKWVASEKKWLYQPIPVHGPFYDRPWIGVIKGPFEILGQVVPYVTFARSGAGANGFVQWMSLGGIHYQEYGAALAQGYVASTRAWPQQVPPDPERDWMQPQRETRITAVSAGLGLFSFTGGACAPWYTPGPSMEWQCVKPGSMTSADFPFVDSEGTLHSVRLGTIYRISRDLGRTWTDIPIPRPDGWTAQEWDYKVNAELGIMAVAVLWQTDRGGTPDEVRAYKFRIDAPTPYLQETLVVGKGNKNLGGGLTSTLPRFDFMTMGIRPDGRLMVSFGDNDHGPPQTAIEI